MIIDQVRILYEEYQGGTRMDMDCKFGRRIMEKGLRNTDYGLRNTDYGMLYGVELIVHLQAYES